MKVYFLVILICVVVALSGCVGVPVGNTGVGAAGEVTADLDAAERDVKSAVSHADVEGRVHLYDAIGNLQHAKPKVQTVVDALKTQEKRTEEATVATSRVLRSWAYRIGSWIVFLGWVLSALLVAHVVFVGLSMLRWVGAPICAIIANIVNPFGWLTWLALHVQFQRAVTNFK